MAQAGLDHALQQYWYYVIELAPGVLTPGHAFTNVALPRRVLRAADVRGRTVVDIGAMEGLLATLAARRGAAHTEAYDRWDLTEKVRLVQQAYRVDYRYVSGLSFADYCRGKNQQRTTFDVVLFSGVLYHLFDPLAGLARVRGLAHRGSLVVVETGAILAEQMALFFNDAQKLYPPSNYFLPGAACLDAMLRFVGLRPVDCLYIGPDKSRPRRDAPRGWFGRRAEPRPQAVGQADIGRLCIVCRVAPIAVLAPDVEPGVKRFSELDFSEFLDLDRVAVDGDPVGYAPTNPGLVLRPDGSVDVWRTVCETPPVEPLREELMLRLDDWS